MEELDVMDRTAGGIPRQRSGADQRRRRVRGSDPRRAGVPRLAPRWSAVCAPGTARALHPPVPTRLGAGPDRAPRTRACLVPARAARAGAVGPGVRSRTERLLVGVAAVLCSAVVVVVLGLVADASAGRADAPARGTSVPVSSVPGSPVSEFAVPESPVSVSSVPGWSGSGGVGPAGAGRSR